MSEIDPEKLEEALDHYANWRCYECGRMALIFAAARAHLSTLPRVKEVEVSVWKVVDDRTGEFGADCTEEEAKSLAKKYGCHAVRLTGTAKVPA